MVEEWRYCCPECGGDLALTWRAQTSKCFRGPHGSDKDGPRDTKRLLSRSGDGEFRLNLKALIANSIRRQVEHYE